ncbi:aldehyde dehydrogenase family protein [Aspergillus heteromorphus CBS 117.55]|uniref:Aldehyde dehydrogenase family protein n=1 Tax=Aspergillus heteromorphus CBS 117.55 TaxID=1448321 RepID=A0A317WRA7_9EURO|nr:aldehyde dehydrogenase family protein [Aspergillus heteromorphus CBS 117.55]PWY87458.1 aldehyde dehydrogenase family protein [Aspergillus heteromorphus CBS 117.55]
MGDCCDTTTPPVIVPLIIDGEEESGASTFDVKSPYTGKTCWKAAAASRQDAIRAVESANDAFPAWSETKPTVRRDILLKAADILESRLEECAGYMRTEMGADVGASQYFVVPLAIRMLRDIAGRITSICGSVPVVEQEGQSAIVLKEPMGVILGVVPWNAPYVFGIRAAACALAGGNTTVIKASEITPRCYWAIGRAFLDAGLPKGCFNVISTPAEDAPELVNAMIEHPAVRKINFTGSTATGRKIATSCGRNLKPCLMELGGKNSAIICADADLDIAVKDVLAGALLNSGQICMSTDRVLVHSAIAPIFMQQVRLALSQMDTQCTPTLVHAASVARVESLVSGAIHSGARLVHDKKEEKNVSDEGIRMRPVVLEGVTEDMGVWNEEAFAPLAACRIVSSDEEAVRLANSTGYGLSAAIFTQDLRKGLAMAKKLQSGAVHINSMTIHDEPVLPHGGVKNSGWGRFNAAEGLNEFLVTKNVTWMD